MPIYEYRCSSCGQEQEVLLRNGSAPPSCSNCNADKLQRKLSVFAVSSGRKEVHPCACASQGDSISKEPIQCGMGACGRD